MAETVKNGSFDLQFAPLRKYQMRCFWAPKKVNARVQYIEKVNR